MNPDTINRSSTALGNITKAISPLRSFIPSNINKAIDSAVSTTNTAKYIADLKTQTEALMRQTNSMNAELAARPKLPSFNYADTYSRAQNTAASTVNPIYTDKLNKYLEGKRIRSGQKTTEIERNKQDIATALQQSIEDTNLARGRTEEDATMRMGDITSNENSFQRNEGRQFDQARSALLGDVANAGLTESGVGQNIVQNAVTDRNLASEDQTREFNNARRDTEVFRTRTLADLDTTSAREQGAATRRTEGEDISLRNFIENENFDEGQFRLTNEAERIGSINAATNDAYNKILAQTIASLAGSGARAQDIALFKQIYG